MDATELAFAGVARQAELVKSREVSPRELVDLYLDRIERLDPGLNAFRVVFAERAHAEAQQAEGRAGAGDDRPLLGVPVAIKDNLDVAGEVSAHGSAAAGEAATSDAEQVRLLRQAGAIVLGKTNMPELEASVGTVSPLFGPTQNPWREGVTPGGSSGGSAAAVAAGLVTAATADDLGGSIRIPAACCGAVGLRPSPDRIPHDLPDPTTFVSRGFITRSVEDARLLFEVVSLPHKVGESGRRPGGGPWRFLAVTESPLGIDPGPAAAVKRATRSCRWSGTRCPSPCRTRPSGASASASGRASSSATARSVR